MNKSNQVSVCPICGSELPTHKDVLFLEHHKRLWHDKAEECGVPLSDDNYTRYFGKPTYRGLRGLYNEDILREKPTELILWEHANPKPEVDLVEFVIALAEALIKTGKVKPDYLDELLARQENHSKDRDERL